MCDSQAGLIKAIIIIIIIITIILSTLHAFNKQLTSFVVSCSSLSVMRMFGIVLTPPLTGLIRYALYTDPEDRD